jgi:hypothetical protein
MVFAQVMRTKSAAEAQVEPSSSAGDAQGGREALLDGLTPKMRRFAQECVANGGNGTAAARAAGYAAGSAEGTASRLRRDPRIAAYLAASERELAARVEVDAQMVLRGLVEVAQDPDHRDRVKALVALGKVKGVDLFADHLKVDGGPSVQIVVGSFAGVVTGGKPGGERP